MTLEQIFSLANTSALLGWIVLALSPLSPKWALRIAGYLIPLLLSVLYAGLIFAFWSRAEGGFDSLANVMLLFTMQEAALAGWVHFLAFDMLVGVWEVKTARREGIPHWMVLPCLALTFMFGPIGFLLFMAIRAGRYGVSQSKEA
ncbi:MAG: ABA4-like family protein [Pseudomonadota bacterium]